MHSPTALFLIALTLLPNWSTATSQTVQNAGLGAQAQLWKYESFCGFASSANLPTRENRAANTSITRRPCAYMEEQFKTAGLKAVLVRFTITGGSPSEIPVAGLDSIRLSDAAGRTQHPVAMLWPVRSDSPTFVTEISGTWAAVIQPKETIDLVFLFPNARVGETIAVGSVPPTVVR